jgi:hypothetical protein
MVWGESIQINITELQDLLPMPFLSGFFTVFSPVSLLLAWHALGLEVPGDRMAPLTS